MEKHICVVEDDEKLCEELVYFLIANGFHAKAAKPTDYNVEALLAGGFSMILLDISLPGADGLFLCREIRKRSDVPVIIITSNNTELTELRSMDCGADDFVAKPLNPQILLARMEAILKRVYKNSGISNLFYLNGFVMDTSKGIVQNGEKKTELTKNELRILTLLAKRQGEIVSRDDLMEGLWESHLFVDDNTLTVNMTRLKGKLEEIGVKGAIVTKRGMGYQLV